LAIIIAIVISEAIGIKIFEKEINTVLLKRYGTRKQKEWLTTSNRI
jgi:hypothetical protein